MDVGRLYNTIIDSVRDTFELRVTLDVSLEESPDFGSVDEAGQYGMSFSIAVDDRTAVLHLFYSEAAGAFAAGALLQDDDLDASTIDDGLSELADLMARDLDRRLSEEKLPVTVQVVDLPSIETVQASTETATVAQPFCFSFEEEFIVEGMFLITAPCDAVESDAVDSGADDQDADDAFELTTGEDV